VLVELSNDLLDNFIGELTKRRQLISLFQQEVGHNLKKEGNGRRTKRRGAPLREQKQVRGLTVWE
jgi:hypothetical protein